MALIDNLIAYYKLDGNSNEEVSANNGSDTNVTYSSGNGKINQGAGFAGNGSIVSASSINQGTQATIACWIKTTMTPSGIYPLIFGCSNIGTNNHFHFSMQSGLGIVQIWCYVGGQYAFKNSSVNINDGNWHFIVGTRNGGTVELFVDGNSQGTGSNGSMTGSHSNTPFLIGNDGAGGAFNGAVDECAYWDRVLSGAEITELYNSGSGLQYPFVPPVVAPSVDTLEATDITTNSGTLNGEITDTGGENADERGFVWDSESKSAPGNVAPASSGYEDYFTDSGDFSEGVFDHGIESLDSGTIYYFRAYAHNSEGYTYGEELTIETLAAEIFRFENIPGVEYNPNDKQTIFAERLNEILDRLHDLDGLDPYEE